MRVLIVFVFLLLGQSAVLAHDGKGCNHSERMAGDLGLNEEQAAAFATIMEEKKTKRRAMFNEHREQMKEKMEALHEDTRQQLGSILTEEQLAAYDEMRAKRIEKMKERHKHRKTRFHKTANDEAVSPDDSVN